MHILDVGRGTLERVADTRDDFVTRIDQDDHNNTWMMVCLVDACVKADVTIGPNQCYGFKIPPMLGGSYTVENMEATDLSVHYSLLGEIFEQTRDLPEPGRNASRSKSIEDSGFIRRVPDVSRSRPGKANPSAHLSPAPPPGCPASAQARRALDQMWRAAPALLLHRPAASNRPPTSVQPCRQTVP